MKNVLEPEETLLLEMHLLHNARRTKGYSAGQNKQTQRNGISSISIIGTRHGAGWTVAALSAPAYVCPAMEASLHHLQRLSTGSTGRVGGCLRDATGRCTCGARQAGQQTNNSIL